MNKTIGFVTCPHCGNKGATVHQNKRGGKLYYRCYESEGSIQPVCGTVQIGGKTGQEWIKNNMSPVAPENPKGSEPVPVGQENPKGFETPKQEPKKSAVANSFLSNFLRDDEE